MKNAHTFFNSRWRWLLLPLMLLFWVVTTIRTWLYKIGIKKSSGFTVPTVIIGNISSGGAGKTPIVAYVITHLLALGYRPAIIMRGYGGNQTPQVISKLSNLTGLADEVKWHLTQYDCPIAVGKNRIATIKKLLKTYPTVNVFICDDGLQHLALKRHINVVVYNTLSMGNHQLLPLGPLRQPTSNLKKADAVLWLQEHNENLTLTQRKLNQLDANKHLFTAKKVVVEAYQLNNPSIRQPFTWFNGKHMTALAAIGQPQSFFNLLTAAGINLNNSIPLPDHSHIDNDTISGIRSEIILVTEKDASKCPNDKRIWVVPLQLHFENDAFIAWLHQQLQQPHIQKIGL